MCDNHNTLPRMHGANLLNGGRHPCRCLVVRFSTRKGDVLPASPKEGWMVTSQLLLGETNRFAYVDLPQIEARFNRDRQVFREWLGGLARPHQIRAVDCGDVFEREPPC